MATGLQITAQAQTSINARLVARPLTPGDIEAYGLPADLEVSGGLSTVGVGQAVYLEVDADIGIPSTNIVVTWASITNKPPLSAPVLTTSPLGTNVPVFGPADQLAYQVASRRLFRADLEGRYTVEATVSVAGVGTTSVSFTMTAASYMGLYTCSLCHSGGTAAPNMVVPWSQTAHASMFSEAIDGLKSSHYNASCIRCHTVGYDTNTNANNGGFDDVARTNGWVFPEPLTNGNWASMQTNYPDLANLANIQCENCHGPGSQHAHSLGNTNYITVSLSAGDCAQCHDDPNNHIKVAEWDNSMHAVTTTHPAGNASCVGCHTGAGFIGRISGAATLNTAYVPINCQTCHEPHGETTPTNNPHLIRTLASVTFENGTTVTNGGEGLLCMECHHSRENALEYASSYHSHFGPHHGPQGDMLEGINGYTYGQDIPSSAHRTAVGNTCVTCHMQTVSSSSPAFLHAGGHTFSPAWENGTNSVDLVAACQQCHGSAVTSFDFPLQDYDGDGVIQGVQTEVQNLLDKLAAQLPSSSPSDAELQTWNAPQLEAYYNYLFVTEDGSMGIHNTAYAVGLIKASIANLTGDANNDGLPDSWQIQYFGTINNPDAAPNANPSGDGVPNWMKYAMNLDPTKPGSQVPGGVVYANGKNLENPIIKPGETNTIEIYTAAEVAFNTQTNVTYQLQAISSLSGGWSNVGGPIEGTGAPMSYVTPTRNDLQMFFRVIHTP